MIFDEQIARKPDHYPWTQPLIDAMWKGHWTPNEFTFQRDLHDFKTVLTDQERSVVTNTLSAIGQIEIAVKLFWAKLGEKYPHPSLIDMGLVFAGVEVIHNRAYEKLLDVMKLQHVFEENLKLDIIKGRVSYLSKHNERVYKDDNKQKTYSTILFTLFVENVSLFSQFYVILWFNRFRDEVLPETANQVAYTKNEEKIHAIGGITIVNQTHVEYPADAIFDDAFNTKILHEAREAFKAESKIIDWMLGDYERPHLSRAVLKEYVKHRINTSLIDIGLPFIYEIDPVLAKEYHWMIETELANNAGDFFHTRLVNYSTAPATEIDEPLF